MSCVDEPPKPGIDATSLGYAAAYMDLGWNRTAQPTITVTEDNIGASLAAAANGAKRGKQQYLYLAILIETTRFLDATESIKQGTTFSKTRLDWQDQVNAGKARVRKASHSPSPLLG